MNTPDWLEGYVDEVNNGHRFGFYVSQGLDISDLNQVNELLIRDGFKPLEPERHKALLDLYKGKGGF